LGIFSFLGQRTRDLAWKKQMAARTFRCGHLLFSRARDRTGRCQQAHHQMVLVERMFMAKSIAAKNGMRNRFEGLSVGCRFITSWYIVKAGSPV
jgi:hypothetical protein